MKKVFLSLMIIILAVLGLTDAGYISYEKLIGVTPVCQPGFDCGGVLNSPWAKIGPFPIAYLGFFYYLCILTLGILNYMQVDLRKLINQNWFTPENLLTALTTFGFGFSLYLLMIMGVILKAWCLYCLLSALTSTTLFITNLFLIQARKRESTQKEVTE